MSGLTTTAPMDPPLPPTLRCPVCSTPVAGGHPFALFFQGKRWRCCSMGCRMAFKARPAHFAALRPSAGDAVRTPGPAPVARRGTFVVLPGGGGEGPEG